MPYIKHQASIINGADNGGGGMKKAGLVYRTDWVRLQGTHLTRNTANNVRFNLNLPVNVYRRMYFRGIGNM
jgi:hypothetical protein